MLLLECGWCLFVEVDEFDCLFWCCDYDVVGWLNVDVLSWIVWCVVVFVLLLLFCCYLKL